MARLMRLRRRGSAEGQRGFALLIVMGAVGVLALLTARLNGAGRTEMQVATNLRANAVVEAAADGAVEAAVLQLLQGTLQPDQVLRIGAARVEVRVRDEADKINPNETTVAVLQALLNNLGVDAATAASLAMAITDWRTATSQSLAGGSKLAQYRAAGLPYAPPNRPFDSVDEIGEVVGMTPALLARLRPYLSVYHEGSVQQSAGNSVAVSALAEAKVIDPKVPDFGFVSRNVVAEISATAATADGARFTRQAIVRIKALPEADEAPYEILTWDTSGR
jgi:general secretion pathway protein K